MLGDDIHSVRACSELGVDVTVIAGSDDKDFGITSGARRLFVEDQRNIESLLRVLHSAGLSGSDFDAVYTTHEPSVVTAAALGKVLNISAPNPFMVLNFRDKSLAKSVLREAGIATAKYALIEDIHDLSDDFQLPFRPAIVKPVTGDGTYRVSVVNSECDLRTIARQARAEFWWQRTFIAEEYVLGEEWFADGIIFGGELRFLSIGAYQQTCLATVSANQPLSMYLFDPTQHATVYERVGPLAEEIVQTLGLTDGVFHMELFHDPESDSLVFGECGARRGGGLVEELVFRKFGVSLAEAAIRCALGIEPDVTAEVLLEVVGSIQLPNMPGTLLSHPSVDELEALPNVVFATIEQPIGIEMSDCMLSTIMKIGEVLLTAPSVEELFRRAQEVVNWFGDRTVTIPPAATAAQLRLWQANLLPARGTEQP
ncbi:ATP-grasp domain-containing protein [Streptomyces sp. NPDC002285]